MLLTVVRLASVIIAQALSGLVRMWLRKSIINRSQGLQCSQFGWLVAFEGRGYTTTAALGRTEALT